MNDLTGLFPGIDVNGVLLAGIVLLVTLILYVIFSLIFVYHWRQYAIGAKVIRTTLLTYFISTGILFSLAVVLLLFI